MLRRFALAPLMILLLLGAVSGPQAEAQRETPAQLAEALPANAVVEPFVADAGGFVVAMAFAPDGRLFYTIKGGFSGDKIAQVRIVENGQLRATAFLTTTVNTDGERGLLGIALDPDFLSNRYVYIFKTAPASETGDVPSNRVIRYTEDPATQTALPGSGVVLLDVPIGSENAPNTNHNGGNLHVGPDGKLYVTIGDYGANPANAQDLSVAMGKIHRINTDGSIPEDNPFYNTPGAVQSIWTYGNRNSFDFTFDPVGGRMFFTENGPGCDDEINLGQAGGNYGWGSGYECGVVPEGSIAPLVRYPAPIGITGIDFYQGPLHGWHNSLFWCAVNNGLLYHGRLNAARTAITSYTVVEGAPECRVDVLRGPDGALYLSANNIIRRIVSGEAHYLPFVAR